MRPLFLRRAGKLARILAHGGHRAALRQGVAASVELDPVPFPSGIRTVIDAGANRGQFAVFSLARFPGATIHCFEPLAGPADRLERVASHLGRGRVTVHRHALGAVDGSAEMRVANEDDSSSLLPLGAGQRALGTREVARVAVAVRRLDAVLGREDLVPPVLLKIDVQGAELEVLRGAEGVLGQVAQVLVECSYLPFYEGQPLADEVCAHLEARGYALRYALPSIVEKGQVRQADLLFTRAEAGAGA